MKSFDCYPPFLGSDLRPGSGVRSLECAGSDATSGLARSQLWGEGVVEGIS
jgi:hypothetical protein